MTTPYSTHQVCTHLEAAGITTQDLDGLVTDLALESASDAANMCSEDGAGRIIDGYLKDATRTNNGGLVEQVCWIIGQVGDSAAIELFNQNFSLGK